MGGKIITSQGLESMFPPKILNQYFLTWPARWAFVFVWPEHLHINAEDSIFEDHASYILPIFWGPFPVTRSNDHDKIIFGTNIYEIFMKMKIMWCDVPIDQICCKVNAGSPPDQTEDKGHISQSVSLQILQSLISKFWTSDKRWCLQEHKLISDQILSNQIHLFWISKSALVYFTCSELFDFML